MLTVFRLDDHEVVRPGVGGRPRRHVVQNLRLCETYGLVEHEAPQGSAATAR